MVARQASQQDSIRTLTAEMSRAFIMCRSRGHRWNDEAHYVLVPDSSPQSAALTLQCERCMSKRIDRITRRPSGRWEFDGRHYEYADGYLIDSNSDIGVTRSDFVDELVRRDVALDKGASPPPRRPA
jgi:hypothetical protein